MNNVNHFWNSGRNWSYLWNNEYIPKWAVVIMIAIFFVGLWILIMATLIRQFLLMLRGCGRRLTVLLPNTDYSKIHSWLMPIFAVGLGCPRWCQMLWGVSGVALYIPWGGKAGPYL